MTLVMQDLAKPRKTYFLERGQYDQRRHELQPDVPAILGDMDKDLPRNRLGFAKWLVDPEHPLTARVAVNRHWQRLFGVGIVKSTEEFGTQGDWPSHPRLLDWLAGRLVEEGWSLKSIHRLILTSHAWCQSSVPRTAALAKDADARLLWRFPPRRLVAEAIRDSMLTVSGSLDPRMGGPGFKVFEVVMENVRHYFPRKTFGPAQWRRMVYMTKFRQEHDEVFGAFDCPDGNQVVSRRTRSTTPLQAMNLLNGHFVLQQAEQLLR